MRVRQHAEADALLASPTCLMAFYASIRCDVNVNSVRDIIAVNPTLTILVCAVLF